MNHISFSAIKDWSICPFKFKLLWVDRVSKFCGTEHTTFGSALHSVLEHKIANKKPKDFISWEDFFDSEFRKEIKRAYHDGAPKFNNELLLQMREQGKELIPLALPALREKFGNYTVLKTELQLMEPIKERKYKFKGFIDLVIGSEDGKIHVIDWKTVGSAFSWKKYANTVTNYQLIYYKHFLSEKLGVEPKDICVHFVLLDRNNKKNKVVFHSITSGEKKTNNALLLLEKTLHSCDMKFYPKNRLSCKNCQFYKTKHCP